MENISGTLGTRQSDFAPGARARTVLLCVLAVLAATLTVLAKGFYLISWDTTVIRRLYDIRLDYSWMNGLFSLLTHMGSDVFVFVLVIAFALWCVRRGWKHDAAWLMATAASGRVLGWAAKLLLQSPRPHLSTAPPIHDFSGYGFPSGHSMMSMVFYGAVAFLIFRHGKTRRSHIAGVLGCASLVVSIGFSRVYLGAHWPSDVVGGYLYGACILIAADLLRMRLGKRN